MARKLARNRDTSDGNGQTRCRSDNNNLSEKKESLTRRSFVKAGILVPLLALVGAADAREENRDQNDPTNHLLSTKASKDPSQVSATATPERTITLQGTGSLSPYEFTVEGTLWLTIGTETRYGPSGTSAEALLESNWIQYQFVGSITDLQTDGAIAVYLDGERINPQKRSFPESGTMRE